MKIKYLGTGAAEGIPALFCQCDLCKKAAESGGREIRTRCGAVLNGRVMLDITPDIYLHRLRYDLNLPAISSIFVTHSHTDHFDSGELTRRSTEYYCHINGEKPLRVYGNEKVCRIGREGLLLEFGKEEDQSLVFTVLHPYETVEEEGLSVTALPAVHDPEEECLIYLIQGGETMLYANDTAILKEETFDFIAKRLKGEVLSLISLDCTFGAAGHSFSHMGFEDNKEFIENLKKRDCLAEDCRILATHFSHNCGMTHEELDGECQKIGMRAAFDGLEWNLSD